MKTIQCKDCGVLVPNVPNNTTRCKPCALKAKRAAQLIAKSRPHQCECGRGPKTHRLHGCAACNAAFEAAHHIERRANQPEADFGGWIQFCADWRRSYYLAKRTLAKLKAA